MQSGLCPKCLTIYWPTYQQGLTLWWAYLQEGFKAIGAKVIESQKLNKEMLAADSRGVIPIDIHSNRTDKRVRVWYDIGDFKEDYYDKVMKPEDYYFKIQFPLKPSQRKNFFPIGQACTTGLDGVRDGVLKKAAAEGMKYDVCFVGRITGYDIRVKAVRLIQKQPWNSLLLLGGFRNRPPFPKDITAGKLEHRKYLEALAQSRICLALPGVGGDWTWRHTEIMGLGCCGLTLKPAFGSPAQEKMDRCWMYVKRDLSDLTPSIEVALVAIKAGVLQPFARNARQYYGQYLSRPAQARYLLTTIIEAGAAL